MTIDMVCTGVVNMAIRIDVFLFSNYLVCVRFVLALEDYCIFKEYYLHTSEFIYLSLKMLPRQLNESVMFLLLRVRTLTTERRRLLVVSLLPATSINALKQSYKNHSSDTYRMVLASKIYMCIHVRTYNV